MDDQLRSVERVVPALALGLALLGLRVAAFQAGQPFRTGVKTVPIYATVTDSRGALVADLGASDFEVEEEGRRRPITVFNSGVQAMTIAILLDHSPSVFDVSQRLYTAVTELVQRLLPGDRACLGTFSHVVTLNPSLTSDHNALLRHLGDDAPFPAGTALWDAVDEGRAAVAGEGGRRVVLIFTDAADNSSRSDIDAVRTALEKDGVMTYGVGVRGQGRDRNARADRDCQGHGRLVLRAEAF